MIDFLGFEPGEPIVVTGGGSGIGEALAIRAAEVGLSVAVWDLNEETASKTASRIEESGGRAFGIGLDVSDRDAVTQAWRRTTATLGTVRLLGAVAGPPSFLERPFTDGVVLAIECMKVPTDAWLDVVDAPERSAIYLSSVQGPRYGAGVPWYTVAKSAIDGYMRSNAAMRPGGIRANAVLPDWTLTPRTQQYIEATGGPEWDANPMGRVGYAVDIANAALFLLSPAAGYINGVSLEVDGGSSLRSLTWMRMRNS